MTYQLGNTIRLTALFKDWTGVATDPTDITLTISDSKNNPLETITIDIDNKVDVGKYTHDHPTTSTGIFIYEWSGTLSGTPSTYRDTFEVTLMGGN